MIRFWVDHPVATWMLCAGLLICGVYALPRLNIEAMPQTDLPKLTIYTTWPGASPSAVQRSITLPVEEAASQCHGIESVESTSRHSQSVVEVSYQRDTDIEFARLELSEQLGSVRRNLPARANQPVIRPDVPEQIQEKEFFSVSLISPLATNDLREKAEDWLVPRFLAIPGVANAELLGGALPELKVKLNLELIERYGLTPDAIAERLNALDMVTPAGVVRRAGQELTVTVHDSVTVAMLQHAVLRTLGGQPVTLADVASVERGHEDVLMFRRINGQNVISLRVTKRSGENSVGVSRRLRHVLPAIEQAMPFAVKLEVEQDEGKELESKLRELVYRSFVILALLFILLAIALRRFTLVGIVIASILLAIVICLSLFYFFGISVNFITISGLTICFGMLLDNSILVLDSVHRHLSERRGGSPRESLIRGTREVSFPIMATTLTTVVAFLSFIYMTGRLALFYVPLAISIAFAMLASIFVAFCWMPVALRPVASREQRRAAETGASAERQGWGLLWRWSLGTLILALVAAAAVHFAPGSADLGDLLPWIGASAGLLIAVGAFLSFVEPLTWLNIRLWFVTLTVMAGLFAGSWWAYQHKVNKGGFWQPASQETLRLYFQRPVGTDVTLTSETMRLFENEVSPLPDGVHMRADCYENIGFMQIEFKTDAVRYSSYPQLYRNKLIVLSEELGGMFIFIGGFGDPYLKGGTGGASSNSTILLAGYNSKELKSLSDSIVDRLGRNRRVRNVRLTSGSQFEREGTDETVVIIRRDKLAEHRLTVGDVVRHLSRLLGIDTPWHMIVEGEDKQVQLSFDDADDIQYNAVLGKTMTTSRGQVVRLGDLVRLETRPELTAITRKDQRYSQRINWEFVGTPRMRAAFVRDILAGLELPYGFTAEDVSGQQITQEEKEELARTLWLTVLFIYMTLAALIESFTLPIIVLLAVPMALVGVVGIFWADGSTFDSSAQIGLILMFGVVVNNAILLVNRYRLMVREIVADRGLAAAGSLVPAKARLGGFDLWRLPASERLAILKTSIVTGTRIQMRSILLTSGTTIFGMLPLLYQIEKQSDQSKDIWTNLALASVGGLTSSTVLLLSAIPAMYWICTRWGWGLAGGWHRLRGRHRPDAGAAAVAERPV